MMTTEEFNEKPAGDPRKLVLTPAEQALSALVFQLYHSNPGDAGTVRGFAVEQPSLLDMLLAAMVAEDKEQYELVLPDGRLNIAELWARAAKALSEHGHANVRKDGLPHSGNSEGSKNQADCFYAQRKADVFPHDFSGSDRNFHDAHNGRRLI